MPSLLVIVFVIQLLIHLVNTIGAAAINETLWNLYCRLPLRSSQSTAEQIRLRNEVVRLKREMAAVSAQDEFTRWAKLRRQHDKALAEHDKTAETLKTTRSTFDRRANYTRWTLTTGLRFFLQFWHGKTPIFTFPRGWVPWYVEWTLAFPRAPSGSVSINVWSAACAAVLQLVGDLVVWAMVGSGQKGAKEKGEPMKFGAGSGTTAGGGGGDEKKEL